MPTRESTSRLAEQIFSDLRRRIILGELAPGKRLPAERQLAEAYGATRNTVREAIRKLEQGRLVTVRHGQGVTVSDFRRSATLDILEPFLESCPDPIERGLVLRELLQARTEVLAWAVQLAAQRRTAENLARVESAGAAILSAACQGEAVEVARQTQRLIDGLIDAAHSLPVRWLANAFLELHDSIIERFPALCVLEPGVEAYVPALQAALRDGDADTARQLTRDYFERVDRLLLSRAMELAAPSHLPPRR
ncbi:MAG: GntR family transcriptional regulator [Pseudomonadota bacterium]